jgi:hypothetical protein
MKASAICILLLAAAWLTIGVQGEVQDKTPPHCSTMAKASCLHVVVLAGSNRCQSTCIR